MLDRFEAPGARRFKFALKAPFQANVGNNFLRPAVLVDDLGAAFCGQIASLRCLFTQVNHSRPKAEVKIERFLLKLQNFYFHPLRVRRTGLAVNCLPRCGAPADASLKQMGNITPTRVRTATEADLDPLVELVNEAYRMEEAFLEGRRIDLERMKGHFASGTIYVAEAGPSGQLVASVHAQVLAGEAKIDCVPRGASAKGGTGYIGLLAVDPACRGKGLARRMMAVAEDGLRNIGCVRAELSVLSMLPELPPLYERLGYVRTGISAFCFHRKLKPGVECHVIQMAKKL